MLRLDDPLLDGTAGLPREEHEAAWNGSTPGGEAPLRAGRAEAARTAASLISMFLARLNFRLVRLNFQRQIRDRQGSFGIVLRPSLRRAVQQALQRAVRRRLNNYSISPNFRRSVLGCIDSYDSNQILILLDFSRSTRFAILCTAQIVKFELKTRHNFGGFE